MHSSDSRNPCSHICTGELKYTVVRIMCTTSGGAPGLCWWNQWWGFGGQLPPPLLPNGARDFLKTDEKVVVWMG